MTFVIAFLTVLFLIDLVSYMRQSSLYKEMLGYINYTTSEYILNIGETEVLLSLATILMQLQQYRKAYDIYVKLETMSTYSLSIQQREIIQTNKKFCFRPILITGPSDRTIFKIIHHGLIRRFGRGRILYINPQINYGYEAFVNIYGNKER